MGLKVELNRPWNHNFSGYLSNAWDGTETWWTLSIIRLGLYANAHLQNRHSVASECLRTCSCALFDTKNTNQQFQHRFTAWAYCDKTYTEDSHGPCLVHLHGFESRRACRSDDAGARAGWHSTHQKNLLLHSLVRSAERGHSARILRRYGNAMRVSTAMYSTDAQELLHKRADCGGYCVCVR